MVTYLERAAWTNVPRPDTLTPFDAPTLRGIAAHWTGSPAPLGPTPTLTQTARRIEGYRRLHTDPEPRGRGWSDLAYNVVVDQAGRVFEGRGIAHRSAGNGGATVNRTHGAVLLLVGRGETPTQAMLDAVRSWRRVVWLRAWPAATGVVGHRDLHPTECPGPAVYDLVRSGRFAGPPPPQEDDMALSDDDVDRIADRVADRLLAAPGGRARLTAKYVAKDDGEPVTITDALTRLLARTTDR